MKKRYFALLLCVHMVLFMIFQAASNVMAEEDAATQIDAQTDNEENSQGQAENSSEWLSYKDFILSETTKAWNNPAMYVGFTAEFNTKMYGNFACVSSGDVIDFGSDADVSKGDANVSDGDTDVTGVDADITDQDTDYYGDDTDFFYSGDDFYEKLLTFANFVYEEELLDAEGNGIKVIITDYYFDDTSDSLWYKVEAVEGYTLPDVLVENPYVLHLTYPEEEPCILMHPRKAMFVGDKVSVQKNPVAASRFEEVAVDELPDFFDITWSYEYTDDYGLSWYDFGDISGWAENLTPEYRYISTSYVKLIPAEVSHAYEMLMSTEDTEEYYAYLSQIPEEITRQFTDKHIANLEEHQKYLRALENVEHSTNAMVGDKEIPITVTGKIPETGVTLNVSAVSAESVLQEGFDIKDATEIVTALDIKMINDDGTEWQPKEGDQITVSIDMAELGYEDGDIVRLHHKHGEDITVFEVFIVIDGKLTVRTGGFSLFVISDFNNFNQSRPQNTTGTRLLNPGDGEATQAAPMDITLTVGQTVVYYGGPRPNETVNNPRRTWWVTDPEGAIYYEIYTSSAIGNTGVDANWLRVTALKETEKPVLLRHLYVSGNTVREQWYNLSIVPPKPEASDRDGYKLYIKDKVNTAGVITATLINESGKEVVLSDKITYSWVRDDGAYIYPDAYKEDGKSIDICLDHGGLLQSRLTNVTYTVTATMPNGMKKTASYTVYYQSEILNANFEAPDAVKGTYTFFTNGWPQLYWKTTSPGTGTNNLTKDIEYARYNDNGQITGTTFFPTKTGDGDQFAELNAENFGALYQDIITAPTEYVTWKFLHAKRNNNKDGEAMYLIIGPTEYAQEVTDYDKLRALVTTIRNANTQQAIDNMEDNGGSISYRDDATGAEYQMWYHDADNDGRSANDAWTTLEGKYKVPNGQYRTRLFFVTDPLVSGKQANYGNLIDSSLGGQYKEFLIEYYEEDYLVDKETGATTYKRTLVSTRKDNSEKTDESGRAIMYASVELQNFTYFEEYEKSLLSTVFINGQNSPYNIKYAKKPCLFIEKYPELEDEPVICLDETKRDERPQSFYDQYDVVMQVCFRDTMIAVQKWVDFPKIEDKNVLDDNGNPVMVEALTAMQKQDLIDELIYPNGVENGATGSGYEAVFDLHCLICDTEEKHFAHETITITENDPAGWYTGYIPLGDNPDGNHTFKLEESYASPLTGLEIDTVRFDYYQFLNGKRKDPITIIYEKVKLQEVTINNVTSYELVGIVKGDKTETYVPVEQNGIILNDTGNDIQKLAEIKVTNTYREKVAKITYKAVGNGQISIQDDTPNLTTTDFETFAFYSGEPDGAVPQADSGYTFAGWYLDEDCTLPVDENHGYVGELNNFVPNKAKTISDTVLEVTYYAKFSSGSLQIIREQAEPGEVFVYEVRDAYGKTMYVTVEIGPDGKGSTEIVKASFGANNKIGLDYTVTQLNDWSWRYDSGNASVTKTHKETIGLHGAINMITVFNFPDDLESEQRSDYWLNGNSEIEVNTYGGGAN